MLLDDISDYLTSQSGGAIVATSNLFVGRRPPVPDECVTIYETAGPPTIHAFNPLPGQAVVEQPRIQVVARGAAEDYAAARTLSHRAFMLLDGFPRRLINGVEYCWGSALGSPALMGYDELNRPLVTFSIDLVKRLSTTS